MALIPMPMTINELAIRSSVADSENEIEFSLRSASESTLRLSHDAYGAASAITSSSMVSSSSEPRPTPLFR